jgi:hypothetical protein
MRKPFTEKGGEKGDQTVYKRRMAARHFTYNYIDKRTRTRTIEEAEEEEGEDGEREREREKSAA